MLMAVCIGSDLGKDIAGEPLLRGVSFKLERGDRLTLSGRNGSGKTTLLRMLAGETSIDFGQLVFEKGARVALHDQRPPRERDVSLRDYVLSGAAELVAHDRWFLEAVGTAVLELEAGRGRFFAGPWHAWRKEQAARAIALGRAIERQQAEIQRLERFVTRFRAGTRARQAQSRAKKLSKMQRLSADPGDGAALQFAFKPPERSGRVIFELEHAELSAGDKALLHDAELW